MDRRTIICAVGATLALNGVPFAVSAQPRSAVRRIGLLTSQYRPTAAEAAEIRRAGIEASLRQFGWVEGENLVIERRYADGRVELLKPFAEEFVRLNVDVIVANGTDAAIAAKNATTRIPIVMTSAGDPLRTGLVPSLARPGGNITGFSITAPEADAKLLSLLREVLPEAQRVGVLVNPTNPIHSIRRDENERVYRSLGIQPIFVQVSTVEALEDAVAEVSQRRGQALVLLSDSLFLSKRNELMRAALRYSLPPFVEGADMLRAGGLVSYAVKVSEQRQRVAALIDKLLRGAKPADLPIEQPTKFELGINLKTAKALGITIPQSLLLRADEVVP